MKIQRLLPILMVSMMLYGDVMYEMATTTGDATGLSNSESMIRTFIKLDCSRTEITVESALTGPIVNAYIVRLDKREIWMLDPVNKEYSIMPLGEDAQNGASEEGMDSSNIVPEIKVQSLDEKKTLLEVECQKYLVEMKINSPDRGVTLSQTMWISREIPGYEEISSFNKRLVAMAGGVAQQSMGGIDKKAFRDFQEKIAGIDGFPLEIDMDFSMPEEDLDFKLKTHSIVKKVSIVPISDKVFEIPEGYVQKQD
jgi:hypothetical protein